MGARPTPKTVSRPVGRIEVDKGYKQRRGFIERVSKTVSPQPGLPLLVVPVRPVKTVIPSILFQETRADPSQGSTNHE